MQQMGPPPVASRESCIEFQLSRPYIGALQSSTKTSAGRHPQNHMQKGLLVFCGDRLAQEACVATCMVTVHGTAKPGNSAEFSSFPNRPSCTCPHGSVLYPLSRFTFDFVAAFPKSPPSLSIYLSFSIYIYIYIFRARHTLLLDN
jgi:hypothetical protein